MPSTFVKTISILFHDATVSVNIHNQATKPFELHRGVCQGCPLAPYLLIITGEALNATLKHAIGIGNLEDVTLPQCNFQQIISQNVDDTSFTVEA